MTPEQVQMLERVLPPRMHMAVPPPDAMTEDFQLDDVDQEREGGRAHGASMEDDDEEMGAGGERVQCASQ